jgi:hypothetical protein
VKPIARQDADMPSDAAASTSDGIEFDFMIVGNSGFFFRTSCRVNNRTAYADGFQHNPIVAKSNVSLMGHNAPKTEGLLGFVLGWIAGSRLYSTLTGAGRRRFDRVHRANDAHEMSSLLPTWFSVFCGSFSALRISPRR